MIAKRTISVEQFKNATHFEGLCKVLLGDAYRKHLDKPLAYWALPSDRRLPLALLGRTLEDLLQTPFDELAATPGIGEKKISSLVTLLGRVVDTDPEDLAAAKRNGASSDKAASGQGADGNGFDPTEVSELVWNQWRTCVIQRGLGEETLGRLTPSLRHLSRANWDTPLAEYAGRSLAEIRTMKTHGEKRVHAILEVFYYVHKIVGELGDTHHLAVRIGPRLIGQADHWVERWLHWPGVPGKQEICGQFISPLLQQIRADAAPQVVRVVENRLGILGPITSVREAAHTMGLTRARIYQLLDEASDMMGVRFPEGRGRVYALRDKFLGELSEGTDAPGLERFTAAVELFYPESRRGSATPPQLDLEELSPADYATVAI